MLNAEVSAEYYQRAFVARNLAATTACTDTKVYLLELEQLWLFQARRHESALRQPGQGKNESATDSILIVCSAGCYLNETPSNYCVRV